MLWPISRPIGTAFPSRPAASVVATARCSKTVISHSFRIHLRSAPPLRTRAGTAARSGRTCPAPRSPCRSRLPSPPLSPPFMPLPPHQVKPPKTGSSGAFQRPGGVPPLWRGRVARAQADRRALPGETQELAASEVKDGAVGGNEADGGRLGRGD